MTTVHSSEKSAKRESARCCFNKHKSRWRLTSQKIRPMYEDVTANSNTFTMQTASNGSMSSGGRYGNSYYSDPSGALLSSAAANAATGTYGETLLQPTTVCYAPSYTADGSSGAGCKQLFYHQEGSFGQEQNSPSSTRFPEVGLVSGHHPGRAVQTSSTSSSPSAAAAAAVAEATSALRLATSYSMFAVKSPPSQPAGTFSVRGPTADGFAVADRLAAKAAAAAADFVPASAGLSSGYVQPSAVGLGKFTASTTYGTNPTAFHLSSASTGDGSTSFHGGFHGFHPTANGFLYTAGASGETYSQFQKLQTPWTTSRMSMDAYSSLDVCKFPVFPVSALHFGA